MRIIIIIIIAILLFSTTVNANNHITYVSLVDPNLGFYKVTDSTTHKPAPYEGRVLTINQGDNVIWKNDADPSSPVTIVSNQNLFQDTELKLINDVFSYKFDQPGIYTFYIKEREMAKQTIIVNSEGFVPDKNPVQNAHTPTITPTDTPILNTTDITNTKTIANISNKTDSVNNINNIDNINNINNTNNTNTTGNNTNTNTTGNNTNTNTTGNNTNTNTTGNIITEKISMISIASIMVAIISILTMFSTRRR